MLKVFAATTRYVGTTRHRMLRSVVGLLTTVALIVGTDHARAPGALRRRIRRLGGDAGMSTAEYAVGTIAACAFAAVLYQVVTGASVVSALRDLIASALSTLS